MTAYGRIVVGAHGSPTSEVAEEVAARLAHELGAKMIHVSDDTVKGEDVLRSAAERTRAHGVEAETRHRDGDVAESIVAAAAELRADLLVIGGPRDGAGEPVQPRGASQSGGPPRTGRHPVVRTANPARHHTYRRILIATDGSLTAHQATRHGYGLAEAVGAEVTLIYVGDELIGDIVLRNTAARLDGETIDRIVTKGNPAAEISKEAGSHDLVVVGNKGMTGSRRYIQRVVPSRVAHEAPSDVLIVKTVSRSFFDLRPGEGAVVEVDGEKVAAYLHADGTTYALTARCTHLGCIVGWNSRARTWDCPCHGSRFEYIGMIINGPGAKPLPPVQL